VNTTNIIEGQSVNFTFTGSKGDEPSVLQWNFGDSPTNVTEINPIYQFERAGAFEVVLSITDKYGELNYTTMMIVVDESAPDCQECPEGEDYMIYAYIFAPINVVGILVGLYFIKKKN
jgi:PKD repeat protein